MVAIHHLLYQLHLTDQAITQLLRKIRNQLNAVRDTDLLLDNTPCSQVAVQEV